MDFAYLGNLFVRNISKDGFYEQWSESWLINCRLMIQIRKQIINAAEIVSRSWSKYISSNKFAYFTPNKLFKLFIMQSWFMII